MRIACLMKLISILEIRISLLNTYKINKYFKNSTHIAVKGMWLTLITNRCQCLLVWRKERLKIIQLHLLTKIIKTLKSSSWKTQSTGRSRTSKKDPLDYTMLLEKSRKLLLEFHLQIVLLFLDHRLIAIGKLDLIILLQEVLWRQNLRNILFIKSQQTT
jgi:hypothetical protein